MPLSEHVYCVASAFKMTEQVEQWFFIKFCVKLKYSSTETFWMIQKAAAMSNWWSAASSQQRARSCTMSCTEFFGKTSNHPGDSAPLQPRFGAPWLLTFPKIKITFEREEIWVLMRFRKIQRGSWWWLGELCEVPRCLLLRGLRCHCPMYNVSFILHLLH